MTLSTHAVAGILLAQWSGNPALGFFLALCSHYILDVIPHGDEFVYWRYIHDKDDVVAKSVATIDTLILSTIITLLLTYAEPETSGVLILLGALGGILPDLCITIESILRRKKHIPRIFHPFLWFIKQHYDIHMFFHQLLFIPIRFRVALFVQMIALSLFLVYAL